MPFCPSCHCEYQPGFTHCTDCDVALVDALSEANSGEPDKGELRLVELGTFPDPMAARMFEELLESNGIITVLQSDFNAGAGTYTASPNALLVREADFQKAREIYEEYFAGDKSGVELEEEIDYQEDGGGPDDND